MQEQKLIKEVKPKVKHKLKKIFFYTDIGINFNKFSLLFNVFFSFSFI